MAMARVSSGLAYPERFYAAASYAGFSGSPDSPASKGVSSKFKNDVSLLLYALYQQATVGPCNVAKPSAWSPVEQSKWQSWNGLGNMASTEAMRLFVKILEEEDPGWYSRADTNSEPVVDVQMHHNSKVEAVIENGNAIPETKMVSTENGTIVETRDKDVVSEGNESISIYDHWVALPIVGQKPKPRYEHGAAVIGDKMYVYGGNHNGRYLSDLQVLDLKTWTWSRVEVKAGVQTEESESSVPPIPCAGHALIPWGNKLLSVAGHTKDPSETIQVRQFDLQTSTWSILKTYGKPPVSRGGHSVTLVGSNLIIFGGQNANRTLLNDLHLLDLETMTWDEFDAVGVPPSPRSDHAAAVHAERYLLIFGGGSHATCFNDLHVLDLQAMEWSRPTQQGDIPSARAGHAGVTIGENWFIVGGGDNRSGASETVVLNMSTLVWSVVTSVEGRVSLASEGLSLVVGSYNGEDVLVSFGGYNGHYNNEIHILKPSNKSTLQSKMIETPVPESVPAVDHSTNGTRDLESELDAGQSGRIREIVVDNVDKGTIRSELSGDRLIATLKKEKEELDSELNKERLQNQQLKKELAEAETRNTDLYQELQSVRGQLAAEQSRCFKLEVDVAELRQKLQTMETLEKELELLRRQKAASEQAALNAKQRQGSGGVWGWLAGNPSPKEDDA
uniref:Acyl-CoA-binding domain-containing protein 5 n=1 Tax=Selenicereus monacanthus TaxID=1195128 RepID=A0A249Y6Z8_9CARY|nr:acyl-CoA-binding domain-containing protein 5 [Selenicereus monacanthus]